MPKGGGDSHFVHIGNPLWDLLVSTVRSETEFTACKKRKDPSSWLESL
jgi:hypothetical protein